MPKRFVLSGYFGFKNFGDEAILSVLVDKLQAKKHRITVISSNPEWTKSKYKHIRSVYTFDFGDIIGAIFKSDYLISGGGSLLQDSTSLKSLIYYLFVIFIALLAGKKVIIFAQGIGPITNPIGQFLTKLLLKRCIYVSVRDEKSQSLLKSWGIDSELLCDPVFSTQVPQLEKKGKVAIQLRNFKTMTEDFIDRLAMAVNSEFYDKEIEIYSFQDTIDFEICQRFANSLRLLNSDIKINFHSNLSDSEVIAGISQCEYLIAMRFHAIIIGLLAGVKTMCINYDIKVEKIASEFSLPMVGLNSEIKDKIKELKHQKPEEIEHLVKSKVFDWSSFDRATRED